MRTCVRACVRVCVKSYFGDIGLNGLIWGRVLCFASAMCFEILSFLTFTHNLCDDVCNNRKARVWIYSDCKCLLVWMYVFWRTRD